MNHALRLASSRLSPVLRTHTTSSIAKQSCFQAYRPVTSSFIRSFSNSTPTRDEKDDPKLRDLSARAEKRQIRKATTGSSAQTLENDRPWHRLSREEEAEADKNVGPSKPDPEKGRLLTTPTRLLKLILPMPFHPDQEHVNRPVEEAKRDQDERVEPLALLVHPQQPLSYLERLIQAEIPPVEHKGREKLPDIVFRAEADQEEEPDKKKKKEGGNGTNVASYSGLGHEGASRKPKDAKWVRWSGSTEVGDFIRDAARGREFAIHIEGFSRELRVAVPSFKDRTYYMRMRLRKMSREIDTMSKIKNECDAIAQKSAHHLAQGGFGALVVWWGIVYYTSFHTDMGWDLVEPVTYLAGLTTIMAGYLWFLFISRDLSYKAAMKVTVSKRQHALYQERGFDQAKWDGMVLEANSLRREVKTIAAEYDVDWDDVKDLGGEEVKQVLEEEKKGRDGTKKTEGKEEEEDDDHKPAPKSGSKKD